MDIVSGWLEAITFDFVAQIFIGFLSVSAIYLVAKSRPLGFWLGLASQPFWFYTTFIHKQWIIFALTALYTWSWGTGVYENYFKKKMD